MSSMEIQQEYEVIRIDGRHDLLKEHPQNPNLGKIEVIEESIDVNGWYGAVIAQKSTGYILAGNHRYRVAKERGAKELPVIWKDVDDETALKILTVDNKSTRDGEVDEAKLEELLASLETLDGSGYVLASLQEQIEDEANGAEAKAEPAPDALDPDDIPDDVHVPEYGIMVLCTDEADQEFMHRYLRKQFPLRKFQVVAV